MHLRQQCCQQETKLTLLQTFYNGWIMSGSQQRVHLGKVLMKAGDMWLPAIGQEELWDELLDISRVVGDALPGGGDAVEHAVRHIKPAGTPARGDCWCWAVAQAKHV